MQKMFLSLGIVFVLGLSACTPAPSVSESGEKAAVAASFYPLAYFAEQIGKETVTIAAIVPSGTEPHDFEPTPGDIVKLYESSLFLYNGAGVDSWADHVRSDLEAKGVSVIEMATQVTRGNREDSAEAEEHGMFDPHFWLDPVIAQQEAVVIRDALIAIAPSHEDAIRAQADSFMNELRTLDQEYRTGLSQCAHDTIITTHDAFRYIGDRYGFDTMPISGISPEEEPSAQHLAELTDLARELQIEYIFTETLSNPRFAETIAREAGVQTLVLNPIEGITSEERAAGATYLTISRENLEHLRTALACE